ncbi:MAG: exosortase C-terminal domain/associated protein EpsI, partial [Gemmatimonadota bacterium]
GYMGMDLGVSDAEAEVAGFSNYLFRVYEGAAPAGLEATDAVAPMFSVYVGFYESQTRGNTIHSPKNCLPGAGWEALSSEPLTLELNRGPVTVNRYLLQNENERALVLYWYQGRGRIAYDEYKVKLNLLRDAAFRRRSDEALVRIVVPLGAMDEDSAMQLAVGAARVLAPSLDLALPAG